MKNTFILAVWAASTVLACATDHFVSLTGAHNPPFTTWADAATNIQAAIDVASMGDTVWVTNGIYATGGKAVAGDLTNRVALDKPLTVTSVNGAAATTIQGAWDGNTNGPLAVRCAWVTNGAILNGFTLQGGATRIDGDSSGGGVWGSSTQAVVIACWIFTNTAAADGGGSFQATLDRCKVIGNLANKGGGAANGFVKNSFISENTGTSLGGGSYECHLHNCTIVDNRSATGGGVVASSTTTRNSIIYGNHRIFPALTSDEYYGSSFNITYCCVYAQFPSGPPSGAGNFSAFPQFTDQFHLALTSPCRGTGNAIYASDTDIDGELWAGPPSIGCDEIIEANINGPLSVSAKTVWSEVAERQRTFLIGEVSGRATRLDWYFGDGSAVTNESGLNPSHVWTNAGDYTATFTAYNSDHTNGVSANVQVHVVPLVAPTFLSMGLDGANFTLNFLGQSNVSGILDYATNLTEPVTWKFVGGIFSNSNLIQVIDRNATNSARFYRVRIP